MDEKNPVQQSTCADPPAHVVTSSPLPLSVHPSESDTRDVVVPAVATSADIPDEVDPGAGNESEPVSFSHVNSNLFPDTASPGQDNALNMEPGSNKDNSPEPNTVCELSPERNLPDMHAVDQDVSSDVLTESNQRDVQEPQPESNPLPPDPPVRYPTRQRKPPERFQYTTLGNPLVLVIQSLFQGLSNAVTSSLVDPSPDVVMSSVPMWASLDAPVTSQPQGGCSGTCNPSRGEDVTPVIS